MSHRGPDLADDAADTTAALTALLGTEGSLDDLAAVLDHRLAAGELLEEALPLLLADAARRAEIAKPGYTDDTTEQIAAGLGELVGAEVRVTGMASVGAQRATFFIDILDGSTSTPAVAQVSASVLGSVPASAEADMLRLADRAGVPVPDVIAVSDDLPGVGAPALVVSRIEDAPCRAHPARIDR